MTAMAWSPLMRTGLVVLAFLTSTCLSECPTGCSCKARTSPAGYEVTCSNLTKFPNLPMKTSDLRISRSTFTDIQNGSFSNATDLVSVEIEQCDKLNSIEGGLFQNLTKFSSFYLDDIPSLTELPTDLFLGAPSVTSVQLENTNIASIDGSMFDHTPGLETLKLTNKTVETLSDETFTHLSQLKYLVLIESNLTSIPAGWFTGLTQLEELILTDNMISTLSPGAFQGLKVLRILRLSNNQLASLDSDLLSGLTALLEVELSQNMFTSLPVALADIPSLDTLIFEENPITTIGNSSFQGLHNLTKLVLNKMPTLQNIETLAFEGLSSLQVLSLSENTNLASIPSGALNATFTPALLDIRLANNGLLSLDDSLFTNKSGLKRVTIEGNPFVCDCGIFGLRLMMDDSLDYPFVAAWQRAPLAPLCKSPKRFEQRTIFSLSTDWDLVCGKPAIKYRTPESLTATEGGQITLQVLVVSTWAVNQSWVNPAGAKMTAPFASTTAQDRLLVNETLLENGTVVCELSIDRITAESAGLYTLTAENQRGAVALEFKVGVGSAKLGSIEVMVIILCLTAGLVIGSVLVGFYFKTRKTRQAADGEETSRLLAGDRAAYGN